MIQAPDFPRFNECVEARENVSERRVVLTMREVSGPSDE